MSILGNILLSPVKFPIFIAKKVSEIAMKEIFNEEKIREDLKKLYTQLEKGEISEEEFESLEEGLVGLLEEAIANKQGT